MSCSVTENPVVEFLVVVSLGSIPSTSRTFSLSVVSELIEVSVMVPGVDPISCAPICDPERTSDELEEYDLAVALLTTQTK